jgi:hypothetical protein
MEVIPIAVLKEESNIVGIKEIIFKLNRLKVNNI